MKTPLMFEQTHRERICVCVCVREREREREKEKERERVLNRLFFSKDENK